ncbi:putative Receptor-like kinase in in flowers 3 [Tripterygium wilfordii]|uniref:non-specific serine/threonine protein kinase n=2 Tax=Tripterygium wilfordii TaxID=458696 RepID=A0A7J7D2T4_TRIWF|nr:putative Receptor-like kinase in in flowers 3 [Tripterygium wilfordii]
MSMPYLMIFLLLGKGFGFFNASFCSAGDNENPRRQLSNFTCPLDFRSQRELMINNLQRLAFVDVPTECQAIVHSTRLIRSYYLKSTGYFYPPFNTSDACWNSYLDLVHEFIPEFNLQSTCGFNAGLIAQGCLNVSTQSQFETLITNSELQDIRLSCNQSLADNSSCASCLSTLSRVQTAHFTGPGVSNTSDCASYPYVYAAAVANRDGPTDSNTVRCLLSISFDPRNSHAKKKHLTEMWWGLAWCTCGLFGGVVIVWFISRRKKRLIKRKSKWKRNMAHDEMVSHLEMEMSSVNSAITKFTIEEIKKATNNFSRDKIIGMGGYANVYKGILEDRTMVALKRFKNCSAIGDANFAHEVEVFASVRHANIVTLRGYCTTAAPAEGCQRIIVCDLVQNGSLHDHLFQPGKKKLSWPVRQKIAIGTARGLAYLHFGLNPAVIHRDVKASNILLDEAFEPKLADFGLAKFTPDGFSHLSTKVAGTLGYVSPEYALYGQLTEKSDVYSFGVVLLELLSGKEAFTSADNGETSLLTDWAWSLVREHRTLAVIDETMPELGPPDIMEKYILVAVLSSHPLSQARPTMNQIVKLLETDSLIPSIPDR